LEKNESTKRQYRTWQSCAAEVDEHTGWLTAKCSIDEAINQWQKRLDVCVRAVAVTLLVVFSSVQFAKINVMLSAKHFRTTTQ